MMVKKRKAILEQIEQEVNKHHFKKLDPNDKDDLAKIMEIVFRLYPEVTPRTRRDYAKTVMEIITFKASD